jgi:DNA-binding response OmpR family regulator
MKLETEKQVLMGMGEPLQKLMSIPSYNIGEYKFETATRQLIYKTEAAKLTSKEAYLLVMLAANQNTFLDRKFILNLIWGEDSFRTSRSMDVYVCKLRRFLAKDKNINIVNLHGKGHKLIIAQ